MKSLMMIALGSSLGAFAVYTELNWEYIQSAFLPEFVTGLSNPNNMAELYIVSSVMVMVSFFILSIKVKPKKSTSTQNSTLASPRFVQDNFGSQGSSSTGIRTNYNQSQFGQQPVVFGSALQQPKSSGNQSGYNFLIFLLIILVLFMIIFNGSIVL